MSRQPEEIEGFRSEIHAAFLVCNVSVGELYKRYIEEWFKLGRRPGRGSGEPAFRSWMDGRTEPNLTEYYFVARALNGYLAEIGSEVRLWEIDRPPFQAPRGDGDGAANDSEASSLKKLSPGLDRSLDTATGFAA